LVFLISHAHPTEVEEFPFEKNSITMENYASSTKEINNCNNKCWMKLFGTPRFFFHLLLFSFHHLCFFPCRLLTSCNIRSKKNRSSLNRSNFLLLLVLNQSKNKLKRTIWWKKKKRMKQKLLFPTSDRVVAELKNRSSFIDRKKANSINMQKIIYKWMTINRNEWNKVLPFQGQRTTV
jgi:hypothetical protein